jgi:hypothetical protein
VKPKTHLILLAACVCCLLVVPAALAEAAPAAPAEADAPAPAVETPAACPALTGDLALASFAPGDPIALSPCFVSVQCADGSSVSCNGNSSCTTSGSNGRCVTCDGVQQGCCALTCCEQCEQNYDACISTCDFKCGICDRVFTRCVNNCGGCP